MRKKAGANASLFLCGHLPLSLGDRGKGGDFLLFLCHIMPPFYNEVIMDDDVIDISNIPYDEYKKHMQELQEKATCPCIHCEPICDRASMKSICERYQEWLKNNIGGLR